MSATTTPPSPRRTSPMSMSSGGPFDRMVLIGACRPRRAKSTRTALFRATRRRRHTLSRASTLLGLLPSSSTGWVFDLIALITSTDLTFLQIIANIYAIRIRVLGQSSETLLSLLDQSLASWYLALPPHLAYNPASKKVPPPHVRLPRRQLESVAHSARPAGPLAASAVLFGPHSPPQAIVSLSLSRTMSQLTLVTDSIPGQNSQGAPGSFPSHSICTTSANAIAK